MYISPLFHVILDNLNIEICWHPGSTGKVILGVRARIRSRREEGESLYEADSEEQHLVPSQGLPHALPLTNTEGDEEGIFFVSTYNYIIRGGF